MEFRLLFALLLFLFGYNCHSQVGSIDTTFNSGFVSNSAADYSISGNANESCPRANDGSILVGSISSFGGISVNGIVGLDNLGKLDTAFQNNLGTGANNVITLARTLENGKYFLAGDFDNFNGVQTNGTILLNENGTVDMGYSPDLTVPIDKYLDIEEQNGQILALGWPTGSISNSQTLLLRLNLDGSVDTTFSLGSVTNSLNTNGIGTFRDIEVSSLNNKVYVNGYFTDIDGLTSHYLARLLPDGDVDTTFINQTAAGTIDAIRETSLGQLVFATGSNQPLIRLNNDGSIDTSFISSVVGSYVSNSISMLTSGPYISPRIELDENDNIYVSKNVTWSSRIVSKFFDTGQKDLQYGIWLTPNIRDLDIRDDGRLLVTTIQGLLLVDSTGLKNAKFQGIKSTTKQVSVVRSTPDNKILIGGHFYGYNHENRNGIARLFENGDLDLSFDPFNVLNGASINSSQTYELKDIAIQSDGKILVAGRFDNYTFGTGSVLLLRLMPDGSRDTSFNETLGTGINAGNVAKLKVLPNNDILDMYVIGSSGYTILRKLDSNGLLDPNFIGPSPNGSLTDFCLLDNGKILISGNFTSVSGIPSNKLALLNADGTVDASFSSGSGPSGNVTTLAEQSNGRIIVGGSSNTYDGSSVTKLFRIFADGTIDSTFNLDSTFSVISPKNIIVSSDDRVYFTDQVFSPPFSNYNSILRTTVDGAIDTIFFNLGTVSTINSFDLMPENNIVFGGNFYDYTGLLTNPFVSKIFGDSLNTNCDFLTANIEYVENLSCGDTSNVLVNGVNGVEPYLYSWDNQGWNIDDTLRQFDVSGLHQISVTDSLGCSNTVGFFIAGPTTTSTHDLEVNAVSGNFRPGFNTQVTIDALNRGCSSESGQIILVKDSILTYISSTVPPNSISGDTLTWDYSNLVFDSLSFTSLLSFYVSPSAQIGDSVTLYTTITPYSGDIDSSNNSRIYVYPVVNGYDPNDKQVIPVGDCIPHYIKGSDKLTYTVRFQNTGNANAINVAIFDTLPFALDYNSLTVIGASHQMHTEFEFPNIAKFVFDEINLPDSTSNPNGSIGYVIFEIEQDGIQYPGTKITNSASIFFDFNPPIITNSVFNTVAGNYTSNVVSAQIQECDSLFWDGNYISSPGIYELTTSNIYGCDSIITLDLSLLSSSSENIQIQECDSLFWNGTYYDSTGSYEYITTNSLGCDSIVYLDLTVLSSSNEFIQIDDCDSVLWNGAYYDSTGVYEFLTTNSLGCDSTAYLDLVIHSNSYHNIQLNECDSFYWNGNYYFSTGIYEFFTTNSFGCDSTVILDLFMGQSTNDSINQTAIDSFTYNGITYTNSGVYQHTLTNQQGCDSIINLNLNMSYTFLPEIEELGVIHIYPNPTEGNLNLQTDFFLDGVVIHISDVSGRIIDSFLMNEKLFSFDLPKESGMYVVEVSVGSSKKAYRVIKR